MARNSLFRKYFWLCSVSVISSITVLGVVLLVLTSSYFEQDKYRMMERTLQGAVNTITRYQNTVTRYQNSTVTSDSSTTLVIPISLFVASNSIDAEFFLSDLQGNVVFSQATSPDGKDYENAVVPQYAIDQCVSEGIFETTGNMDGFYSSQNYIVAIPIVVEERTVVGVLFASSPADGLFVFLKEITKMFLISAMVVLVAASMFISFLTNRMVRPLKQMLAATYSFSKGDFSKRVPVSGYDEIGQLSMAFNNMASTLATTESSRRSFIANVSHELKTPMTTIGGFVDGILDGTVPEEKRDQYLQVVSTEVKRLSRLVRSMLDTARIEAGELQINPVIFDLSETIRKTIFTFEHAIEEKQLEIRGLEVDKIMVQADPDLMHQVVYNLVENAVKFVNQEGYIEFRYHTDAGNIYVAIRNSGAGLDKEEAPQLFDRFYKSDKSRSLNKSGVGLGLHIVRTIINYHKGEIVVRSVEGEYTEFEFAIPATGATPMQQVAQ